MGKHPKLSKSKKKKIHPYVKNNETFDCLTEPHGVFKGYWSLPFERYITQSSVKRNFGFVSLNYYKQWFSISSQYQSLNYYSFCVPWIFQWVIACTEDCNVICTTNKNYLFTFYTPIYSKQLKLPPQWKSTPYCSFIFLSMKI